MSFAPGTKVWDVKGQMQKLIVGWQKANNEWANTMASGDFPCICPWNEEANRFSHVSWRNTDWLRWLKENMVNRMANGRFLVSPCNTKANIFFHVSWKGLKSHWLVSWNGWMRRWPMRNSHAFLDKMKRLANTFPSVTWRRINLLRWLNGETVKIHFSTHPISWCNMNKLLKRHWLVEKPKFVICS